MRDQTEFVRSHFRRQLIVSLLVIVLCGRVLADTPIQTKASTNFYRFAQEFLRTLYPELIGKRYVVSIESALWYDDLTSPVGEGPKFLIKSCCFGGYLSHDVIGLPQPPPPEGMPPSPPAPAVPKKPLPSTPDVDAQGAIHFKQYLSTGFTFDKQGRLKDFNAEGPAVNDGEADKRILEIVTAHPEWTDDQVIAAIKVNGTKYGPNDKEEFVKNLPLQKLEPFLGRLRVESVEFIPSDGPRAGLSSWNDWTADALAKQKDGTILKYRMFFDHRDGKLIGLYVIPAKPDKAGKE